MGEWSKFQCLFCSGSGRIELGRNEDQAKESVESCPNCEGKGWLQVHDIFESKSHNRLFK